MVTRYHTHNHILKTYCRNAYRLEILLDQGFATEIFPSKILTPSHFSTVRATSLLNSQNKINQHQNQQTHKHGTQQDSIFPIKITLNARAGSEAKTSEAEISARTLAFEIDWHKEVKLRVP